MREWLDRAREWFPWTQALRREFHQYPELGFQEHRTARRVAEELERMGLDVYTGIAETGVVAVLPGREDGPRVLLRADMDALPVQEANDVPYASNTPA